MSIVSGPATELREARPSSDLSRGLSAIVRLPSTDRRAALANPVDALRHE